MIRFSANALDLSLPFYDEEIKLGPAGGGFFRKENDATAFHGGTDFNRRPRAIFEVCAAAPARIVARDSENGRHGGILVLSHFTPGFVPLPRLYWLLLAIMLPCYVILTQVVKTWFYRKYGD